MRDPSGALVVKKSGAGVSARREEWESVWKEKYVVGEVAGALPSIVDGFAGEERWKVGDKVDVNGERYIVRAFENLGLSMKL
jgi:hypothetical protein